MNLKGRKEGPSGRLALRMAAAAVFVIVQGDAGLCRYLIYEHDRLGSQHRGQRIRAG